MRVSDSEPCLCISFVHNAGGGRDVFHTKPLVGGEEDKLSLPTRVYRQEALRNIE